MEKGRQYRPTFPNPSVSLKPHKREMRKLNTIVASVGIIVLILAVFCGVSLAKNPVMKFEKQKVIHGALGIAGVITVILGILL